MNYTPNYNLNQWEAEDRVQRTDFNADNAKIDAVLKAVDAKADTKADSSALAALSQTVTGKGNCQVVFGQYTGDGKSGESYPNQLNFDHTVALLLVYGQTHTLVAPGNASSGHTLGSGISFLVTFKWEDNGVSWHCYNDPEHQMNSSGIVYHYIALLAL